MGRFAVKPPHKAAQGPSKALHKAVSRARQNFVVTQRPGMSVTTSFVVTPMPRISVTTNFVVTPSYANLYIDIYIYIYIYFTEISNK